MIEAIDPNLLDPRWWPARLAELAAGEMTFDLALQLQNNLTDFASYAEANPWNGIVGRILNYQDVKNCSLMERMVEVARQDIRELTAPND